MTPPASLQEMQAWMQKALIHPQAVQPQDVADRLTPSNRLSAPQRLAIYQRSYISRLCLCLAEQFPASRKALGAELFDNFARVYLARDPSDSYTLYDLGRRFPAFLEETRPDGDSQESEQENWVNFMIDLATYERALFVLFDAPGHEGKPWPTSDTPDEALMLQPCFALGAYRFNVASYYHSAVDHAESQLPPRAESYVAIIRYNYLTSSIPITRPHYEFLRAMQDIQSVSASLDQIAKTMGVSKAKVQKTWKTHIRERWIEKRFFVDRDALSRE
ncbi:MAG: DNA-binding domain-containing protein [Hellea sp.]